VKTLLCALVLTVTAVSCSGNPSVKPTSPTVSITITDNQGHGVVIPWAWGPNPSCQSIMEEAMRDVDEWVEGNAQGRTSQPAYLIPRSVFQRWESAKEKCWRK